MFKKARQLDCRTVHIWIFDQYMIGINFRRMIDQIHLLNQLCHTYAIFFFHALFRLLTYFEKMGCRRRNSPLLFYSSSSDSDATS